MAIGLSVAETAIGVSTNVPIRSLPLDRPLLGMGFDFVGGCVEEARILPRIPRKNAYHKPDISTQTSWHTFHKSTRVGDQLEINRRGLQLRVLSELSVGGRIASFLFSRGDLPMSGSVRTRCRGRIASFLICRRDMFMRNEVVFLRPYPGKDISLRWAIGFDSE